MDAKVAVASLAALAQETRLHVYRLLVEAGGPGLAVGEIGASLRIAPATLSFHLKELAHAGLVRSRQDGRFVYYSANFETMNGLLGYLTENCCAREGGQCCAPRRCAPAPRAQAKSRAPKDKAPRARRTP